MKDDYLPSLNISLIHFSLTPSLPRVIKCQISPAASPLSNITSDSTENLAFHTLLRWKMIILPILPTSPIQFSLKGWENVLFELGVKGLMEKLLCLLQLTQNTRQADQRNPSRNTHTSQASFMLTYCWQNCKAGADEPEWINFSTKSKLQDNILSRPSRQTWARFQERRRKKNKRRKNETPATRLVTTFYYAPFGSSWYTDNTVVLSLHRCTEPCSLESR